eukprot:5587634-Amphidinium_carterae.1
MFVAIQPSKRWRALAASASATDIIPLRCMSSVCSFKAGRQPHATKVERSVQSDVTKQHELTCRSEDALSSKCYVRLLVVGTLAASTFLCSVDN